jgi:hypothetical protein
LSTDGALPRAHYSTEGALRPDRATVPQVFNLWQDPQERDDIFMSNYSERTWTMVTISGAIEELMNTYVKYSPRKLQSESYWGPITTLTDDQRFQFVREPLAKEGVTIHCPRATDVVQIGSWSLSRGHF